MISFFKNLLRGQEDYLEFDNFNFKLVIIQELMYEQEVLVPKFDVYEYAKQVPVDFEATYDGVAPEVKDYFEAFKIPKRLAKYVKKLYLDGGNDIYLQLMPYGDGEGDEFDISEISPRELGQFKQLVEIDAQAVNYFSPEATDYLRSQGIAVKEYQHKVKKN